MSPTAAISPTKYNFLILGQGGREHALAKKLQTGTKTRKVFALPGSSAWDQNIHCFLEANPHDFQNILKIIHHYKIDFVLPTTESYLCDGIYDFLKQHHVNVLGPNKAWAKLEQSKIFSKQIMKKCKIPTAFGESFANAETAKQFIKKMNQFPVVIKSDNLAFGKGVKICANEQIANLYLDDLFYNDLFGANNAVVIERYLNGQEFSLICLIDGQHIFPLPLVKDYKKISSDPNSDNTGGMGASSAVDFVTNAQVKTILNTCVKPLLKHIHENHDHYFGVLYLGMMKVGQEFFVLEYNVRFGDPETQLQVNMVENDWSEVFVDFFHHRAIKFRPVSQKYHLGVVVTAAGYPYHFLQNIKFSPTLLSSPNVYAMGLKKLDNQLVSQGGRLFLIYQNGDDYQLLIKKLYQQISTIITPNYQSQCYYRTDIGQ